MLKAPFERLERLVRSNAVAPLPQVVLVLVKSREEGGAFQEMQPVRTQAPAGAGADGYLSFAEFSI